MAEELHWGRNLGCDFAMKSCGEWIRTRKEKLVDLQNSKLQFTFVVFHLIISSPLLVEAIKFFSRFSTVNCKSLNNFPWLPKGFRNLPVAPFCIEIKHDGKRSLATTKCTAQRDSLALCNLASI